MRENLIKNGAGEGNRTLVFSLEGCCSTIELHPHHTQNGNTRLPDKAKGVVGEAGLEPAKA